MATHHCTSVLFSPFLDSPSWENPYFLLIEIEKRFPLVTSDGVTPIDLRSDEFGGEDIIIHDEK